MMVDVHTEEKTKDLKRGRQMRGHSRLFLRAGIMMLAMIALIIMNVGVTLADDQSLPSMTVGYQNGRITAIDENTLAIDGRPYGVTPDVVVLDPEGNQMELSDIRPNCEVKFHLAKSQQGEKIDRIIVYLPQ